MKAPKQDELHQGGKIDERVCSYSALIALILPATFSVALEPIAEMVDTAILGKENSLWLGGLAATNSCLGSCAWLFNFLSYGVTARIAQSLGKGEKKEVGKQIFSALFLALLVGVVLGSGLFTFRAFLLETVLGAHGELLHSSLSYFSIRALGFPLVIVLTSLVGILRGLQKIPFMCVIVCTCTAVNALGTYFSVYHLKWGIEGAAIATVSSFVVGVFLALAWLHDHRREYGLERPWRLAKADVVSLGKDGLNMIGRSGLLTLSFFTLTACATRLGSVTVAAHQIALQVWLFASFFIDGLAITATSLGGKFLGAGDGASYRELSRKLLILGAGIGSLFTGAYWVGEPVIVRVFTDDPSILNELSLLWVGVAMIQPINGMAYVYDGLLFGQRAFSFLRQRMLEGVLLVFFPLVIWGFWREENLIGIWIALFGLNGYRLLGGWWGCRRCPFFLH